MTEHCAICGCHLHRTKNTYARPTVEGRSHATSHHYVAERFFGRSTNRRGTKTDGMFSCCPWGHEGESVVFCYECHEELIHNPVFLPEDIVRFAALVRQCGLSEETKTESRELIAGRVVLFHDVIARGLASLLHEGACSVANPPTNRDAGCHHYEPDSYPERIWVGPRYHDQRIFILGESWFGHFTGDLATDDGYITAYLAGKQPDRLYTTLSEACGADRHTFWEQVMFTNFVQRVGPTRDHRPTKTQYLEARDRLHRILLEMKPRGVWIIGKEQGKYSAPVVRN
jgi:hypothetical protein